MADKILTILCIFLCISISHGESLTQKQEEDAVNYIKYQIQQHEVKDEESLAKLLEKMANLVQPYLAYGIQMWELPMVEPLHVKYLKVGDEGAPFRATFRDVLLYGLSNFNVKSVRVNAKGHSFHAVAKYPAIKLLGHYEIEGKLLMFQLKDHGTFTANITSFDVNINGHFKVKDGLLDLNSIDTDFTYKKFKLHLDNLLNGSAIGEQINKSLNDSVDEVVKELKGGFLYEINKITKQNLKAVTRNLPLAKWQAAM